MRTAAEDRVHARQVAAKRARDHAAGDKLEAELKACLDASSASMMEKAVVLRHLADTAAYNHGFADAVDVEEQMKQMK